MPTSRSYTRTFTSTGETETGEFINTFPVYNYPSMDGPNDAYNYNTTTGSAPGNRLSVSVAIIVATVLIPCQYLVGVASRCTICATGKWEIVVAQKGSSPTMNSDAIPTQYSRVTLEGTDCCRPSLTAMTAENSPELYDPDFKYYVWQQCSVYTAYNQAIQNVYSPEVVTAIFIAD